MPSNPILPRAQSTVDIQGGSITREWYDFFRSIFEILQTTSDNPNVIADILARLDELEQDENNFLIQGLLSVKVLGTPESGIVRLQLENDALNPGAFSYYRTDTNGVKGWSIVLPGEVPTDLATYLVDENGDFMVDENGAFLTADQPDALVTGMLWGSQNGFLTVTPDGGVTQTLVATGTRLLNVYRLSDLPAPVSGAITLANNTEYRICTNLDLLGSRLVLGSNNVLSGSSFTSSSITSTGLPGGSTMITGTSSLVLRGIGLSSPTGTLFNLNDGATGNLLIDSVAITGTPVVGTTANYGNIVIENFILAASANWTVGGTIASFAAFSALFSGLAGQTTLIVPNTTTITRRLRFLYCAVDTPAAGTGFDVSASVTIPDEAYILDNTTFTGAGAPLAGIDFTSNKASFFRCLGIANSASLGSFSMTGNATATVIGVTGTFVKIAGTTTAGTFNQKFTTATTQRLTYAGAQTQLFRVVVFASMTSGNNQLLRMRIAKNGTTITESNTLFRTTGSGEASSVGAQCLVQLAPTDFVEAFVTNDTAATNITVSDMNMTIVRQD